MRYPFSIVLALILLGSSPAHPHGRDRLPGRVDIEVVSENGVTMLTIPHKDLWKGGTRIIRQFLEAQKGRNYGIVIRNMTPERIGVVAAVDGRNIISGKRSELANSEEMYLVNAYDQARFDGWRTDRDTVHRFYFTEPGDSYSERTFHDASAMGVIAAAVYREKTRPVPETKFREGAPSAPQADLAGKGASRTEKEESAGTGFGDAQYSPTVQVAFEPEAAPCQKTLIKYEWRDRLCRKGILRRQETGNRLWDDGEYAPFPPGCRN